MEMVVVTRIRMRTTKNKNNDGVILYVIYDVVISDTVSQVSQILGRNNEAKFTLFKLTSSFVYLQIFSLLL